MSSKGRRYNRYAEPKLNMKKVLGVIVAILVIVMVIVSIVNVIKNGKDKNKVKSYSYYTAYENGKFGVINSDGEIVINPEYSEIIAIPNKDVPIFVCTYDVNDQDGTYKTKVINQKNEEIFKNYDKVEAIDNFDSKQNIWYENNLIRVYKNGKYGLIDCDGKVILKAEYDEITALKSVKENLIVKKDNKVGIVNAIGQIIVPLEYANIELLKEGYKNEYKIVDEAGNSGVISTSGTVIVAPAYKDIKYLGSTEIYAASIDNKWTLINKKGEVLNKSYDDYTYSKGDYVIVKQGEKYGIITTSGEVKIEPMYEELNYAFSVYYIAKLNSKYGIINTDNVSSIGFEYLNMTYWADKDIIIADKTETETSIFDNNLTEKLKGIFVFEEDYIKARIDGLDKYYTYKFEEKQVKDILTRNTLYVSKKDGKYGFVDSQGNVVVNYIYDEATEQNKYGFAAVKQNGLWGAIDKGGKQVLTPQVNLDNNIYIYFIGSWHLADEGFYYTK